MICLKISLIDSGALLEGCSRLGAACWSSGRFHLFARRGIRWTFVERHDDVGAKLHLDVHRTFRREEMRRAVEVAAEPHALVVEATQLAQAHDLVATAVGEERLAPRRESMKPTQFLHQLFAGTKHQVIRVGEDDLGAQILEVLVRHRLHGAGGSDGHEHGRVDLAVGSAKDPGSRPARSCDDVEREHVGRVV